MSSIITVSQLNRYIAAKFKEDDILRARLVRGEISNFVNHYKSGHFYFTLKDSTGSIKAVMFRDNASRLKFEPQNGMSVIVMASVSVFERDGVYQLYVTDMQPEGIGALHISFEQLKEKLDAEGLFAAERKLPLPAMPQKIGIVTAATGAALQDILNVLSRRCPIATACVFPSLVQGADAPKSIVKSIKNAEKSGCDLLIVGRGGGSFEELNAFNDETLARCIADCSVPIISAVGHETDFTIADFAADYRAPTPSAAAEISVPDKNTLLKNLQRYEEMLYNNTAGEIQNRLDELTKLEIRLSAQSIPAKTENAYSELAAVTKRLTEVMCKNISVYESALEKNDALLSSLSYENVLKRGYSIVFKDGKAVTDTGMVQNGDEIEIKVSDGEISAVVNRVKGK